MSDRIDVTATIRATDQASAAINAINNSLKGLSRTAETVGNAFRRVSHFGAFGGIGHNVRHLGGAFREMGHSLHEVMEPLLAIAGITGGVGFAAGLEAFVSEGESLQRMAQILGTTVDMLGAYRYAAHLADIETEAFDGSMKFATMNMRKGALGLDPKLSGLFGKLKIDLKGMRDGSKSAMDYLPQLSDAMRAQTSAAARLAIARAVFGKQGSVMIPFLMQTREELEKSTAEYLENEHITKESAAAASELSDRQKQLRGDFRSLRDAIGNAVVPILVEALDKFREVFKEMKPQLVKDLREAFVGLAEGLRDFDWKAFLEGIKETFRGITAAVHFVGGWRNALLILIALMNGPVIAAFLELGTIALKLAFIFGQVLVWGVAGAARSLIWLGAMMGRGLIAGFAGLARGVLLFSRALIGPLVTGLAAAGRAVIAFGAALLSTPLGWILAAIAAIAVAAYLIYRNWDTIGPWFWRQWDAVKQAFSAAWAWVKGWALYFTPQWIIDNWDGIARVFSALWGAVKIAFTQAGAWLASWIPSFVPDAIMAAWETLGNWFATAWEGVKATFTAVTAWLSGWVAQFIPDPVKAAWADLGSWFATAWDGVKSAFNDVTAWLAGWIPDFVPDLIKDVWATLGEALRLDWDLVKKVFTTVSGWFAGWITEFTPEGVKQAWAGLTDWFDKKWSDIAGVFERWAGRLKDLLSPISAAFSAIGGAGNWALGAVGLGGPQAGPRADGAPAPGSILNTPAPGQTGAPGATGSVKVDVNLGGAVPPGTTVTTRATGNVKPDVGTSMPVTP